VAELADATGGSKAKFRAFAAPMWGPTVIRVALDLDLAHPSRRPVAFVGAPHSWRRYLPDPVVPAARGASTTLGVIGCSTHPTRGSVTATRPRPGSICRLRRGGPARNRYAPVQKGSPFAGMRYALYLAQAKPADLLATDVHSLPLSGEVTQRVPFGDSTFVVTMPRRLRWPESCLRSCRGSSWWEACSCRWPPPPVPCASSSGGQRREPGGKSWR